MIRFSFFSWLFMMLTFSTTPILAATQEHQPYAPVINSSALLQTLLGLILVLLIIALITWLLRQNPSLSAASHNQIKILASRSLGPKERAVLLEIGEQQILVGVTAHQISTLLVLKHHINTQADAAQPDFARKLSQFLHKKESAS